MVKPLSGLLQHAGAILVSQLEAPVPGGAPGLTEPCCDLLIVDEDDKTEEARKKADGMCRTARRLRIATVDRSSAVSSILNCEPLKCVGAEGGTPGQPQAGPAGKQQQEHSGSGAGSAQGPGGATPLLGRGQAAGTGARPSAAAVAAGVSPQGRKRTQAAVAAVEQQPRLQQHQQQQQQEQQHQPGPAHHPQLSCSRQEQQQQLRVGGLCWEGGPVDPPGKLPRTPYRRYFAAFVKDGERICVGDCVELAPLPGEEATRVAEVVALWSEGHGTGAGGGAGGSQERMFARVRRFYRPQETPFGAVAGPGQLFRSEHIDDRLGLAAVQRRCLVTLAPSAQHGTGGGGTGGMEGGQGGCPAFTCLLQLDHELMTLGVLPQDCLPVSGAGDPHC